MPASTQHLPSAPKPSAAGVPGKPPVLATKPTGGMIYIIQKGAGSLPTPKK